MIAGDGSGPRIVALDTGIKTSIIRNFTSARGDARAAARARRPPRRCFARGADGIFLVPGPGDPATLGYLVDTVRAAIGRDAGVRHLPRPPDPLPGGRAGDVQAARSATAAATTRSRTCAPGRIAITAQNHGFAVRGEPGQRLQTDFGEAELTHVNLYDGTIEGIRLLDVPAGCVQYHPEAGPGPARLRRPVRRVHRRDRAPVPRRRDDLQQDPGPRLGPDRDRPGGRVRLLGRPGLQGAAGGGLRGRARQLQPGDDHDRPGVRDRDLRRAAAARGRSRR